MRTTSKLLVLLAAVAAVAAVTLMVQHAQQLPDQPQPVAYDKEPCTHCHMLISDPSYAAQLVTTDGRVLDFDDPGCLLRYVAEEHPDVHRLWFHHAHDDRWLAPADVAFLPTGQSPMGYGLTAVDVGTPGAIDREEATRRVLDHAATSQR